MASHFATAHAAPSRGAMRVRGDEAQIIVGVELVRQRRAPYGRRGEPRKSRMRGEDASGRRRAQAHPVALSPIDCERPVVEKGSGG